MEIIHAMNLSFKLKRNYLFGGLRRQKILIKMKYVSSLNKEENKLNIKIETICTD